MGCASGPMHAWGVPDGRERTFCAPTCVANFHGAAAERSVGETVCLWDEPLPARGASLVAFRWNAAITQAVDLPGARDARRRGCGYLRVHRAGLECHHG